MFDLTYLKADNIVWLGDSYLIYKSLAYLGK